MGVVLVSRNVTSPVKVGLLMVAYVLAATEVDKKIVTMELYVSVIHPSWFIAVLVLARLLAGSTTLRWNSPQIGSRTSSLLLGAVVLSSDTKSH